MTWLKRVERGGRKMGKAWENIGYSVQTAGEEPYLRHFGVVRKSSFTVFIY
jgi:hypothetical protein